MKEQESLLSRRAVLAGSTLAMGNAAAVRGSQANSKISVGLIGSGGRGSYDAAIVNADPRARVLLCAVELCSLHYYYAWDPKKAVANALFADGAAAVASICLPHVSRRFIMSSALELMLTWVIVPSTQ